MRDSFWTAGQMRMAAIAAVLLALLAGVAVFALYSQPPILRVDVGEPGDALALPNLQGEWNADEPDLTYRYRWTKAHSSVFLQDAGVASPLNITFRGQGFRSEGIAPAVMTLTVDSRIVATYTLSNETQTYTAGPIERGTAPGVLIGFDTMPFSPAGERRELGFKLDWVEVTAPPGNLPLRNVFGTAALVLGLFALTLRLFGWHGNVRPVVLAALVSLIGLAAVLAGLYLFRPLVTPVLSPTGLMLGLLGLLVTMWPSLRRWPDWVDSLAMPKGYAAATLLALILLNFGLVALWAIPQGPDIGHADYADNAVVARNLVQGRGLVVDYVAQFYEYSPNITHAAETWPLFQPLVTAPFFLLFGVETWVAKLPNLIILLLLAVAVFYFGSRWWDKRVGLVGALLTLLHPYFFQTVLYPINDLAFALFAFLSIGLIWEASNQSPLQRRFALRPTTEGEADDDEAEPGLRESGSRIRTLVLAGLAAALLIWAKTAAGALLLVGPAALLLWGYLFGPYAGKPRRASLQPLVWFLVPFVLALLPMVIRNMSTHGLPVYSTESLDAWILRYSINGAPPWEDIYGNYLAVANGSQQPNFRWVLGGKYSYDLLWLAIWRSVQDVWNDGILKANVIGLPVFLAALAGWLVAPRRLYPLARMVLAAFLPFIIFVLLIWHYEARYFQVLVPWLYLGVAGLLFWAWDRARRAVPVRESDLGGDAVRSRAGGWSLLLLPIALLALLLPSYFASVALYEQSLASTTFIEAAKWAGANLPADAVVMTRNPWEFNWYAQRKAVMIPDATQEHPERGLQDIQVIGDLYNVGYIWLGGPIDGINRQPPSRPALAGLYDGGTVSGIDTQLVYENEGVKIYRWER